MTSVQEAVAAHFKNVPYTHDNTGTRLFGHDFLHTLLRTSTNSDRAEELVAIYQAVLLGDVNVSTQSNKEWRDYGTIPTPEQVLTVTIPGARKFVNDTVARLTRDHAFDNESLRKLAERHPLSEENIARHYERALALRAAIHKRFGKNLGDIPLNELAAMDFNDFQSLMPQEARNAATHRAGAAAPVPR